MITEKGVVPIKGGKYKVLTEDKMDRLHEATIEVLENIGIKNMHDEAREIMEEKGCEVDHDKKIVKIPGNIMKEYIAKAPSSITLHGRDPIYDVKLDDPDDVYVMGGAGSVNTLDMDGNLRPSTMQDLKDFTRLEDTLENMDIAHFLVTPQDTEFGSTSECEMITFAHNLVNNTRNFYALLGVPTEKALWKSFWNAENIIYHVILKSIRVQAAQLPIHLRALLSRLMPI